MKMERKTLDLTIKYLTDEISSHEEQELKEWIMKSNENEQQFNQVERLLRLTESSFETYTPKTKEQWEKLKVRIEAEIDKPKMLPFSSGAWLRIAAAALMLIGIGSLLRIYLEKEVSSVLVVDSSNTEVENKSIIVEVITEDSIRVFHLPDSSWIRLNKNSEFTYPEEFTGTNRMVTLIGEAFFEVTADSTMPFIVRAGDTETLVLGTSFNIKAYREDEEIEVIVIEGMVELSLRGGESENKVILKANDRGTFIKAKNTIKKGRTKGKKFRWWLNNVEKDIKRMINKAKKKLNINKNKNK